MKKELPMPIVIGVIVVIIILVGAVYMGITKSQDNANHSSQINPGDIPVGAQPNEGPYIATPPEGISVPPAARGTNNQ